VILKDPRSESKQGRVANMTSTKINAVLDNGSQCCVLHAYIDSLYPGRFLLSAECSPFLAYRWLGAWCTNYRWNDSEKDEEHARDEHVRSRKGWNLNMIERDFRLYTIPSTRHWCQGGITAGGNPNDVR
jgi:hypothetical protein